MTNQEQSLGGGGLKRRYTNVQGRRVRRVPVKMRVEMGSVRGAALGVARDLNEGGIQIVSPKTYPVGERLAITLQLPGFAPEFDFVGEVRWVDFAGRNNIYVVGCKFVHTPETEKKLRTLLWEISSGNIPEVIRKPKTQRHRKG